MLYLDRPRRVFHPDRGMRTLYVRVVADSPEELFLAAQAARVYDPPRHEGTAREHLLLSITERTRLLRTGMPYTLTTMPQLAAMLVARTQQNGSPDDAPLPVPPPAGRADDRGDLPPLGDAGRRSGGDQHAPGADDQRADR